MVQIFGNVDKSVVSNWLKRCLWSNDNVAREVKNLWVEVKNVLLSVLVIGLRQAKVIPYFYQIVVVVNVAVDHCAQTRNEPPYQNLIVQLYLKCCFIRIQVKKLQLSYHEVTFRCHYLCLRQKDNEVRNLVHQECGDLVLWVRNSLYFCV